MRVTKKVRAVRGKKQIDHYLFNSPTHKIDAKKAADLRSVVFQAVGWSEPVKVPFSNAGKVAGNAVRHPSPTGKGGVFELVSGEVYAETLEKFPAKMDYWVPKKGVEKKNGDPVLQKCSTVPLHDAYFSLPPWVSEFLSCVSDNGREEDVSWVQGVAFKASCSAMATLESRTGYEGVGIALHPDSRTGFGFHLQFLTCKDGKLLGRSASGERGKKGLRLAGDVNLAMTRFDAVDSVPGGWRKIVEERDYDDVAMEGPMVEVIRKELEERFGQDGLDVLDAFARDYVGNWKKGSKVVEKTQQEELRGIIRKLQTENMTLRQRVGVLESKLFNMKNDLGGGKGKEYF
jgi:hypothetical protein